MLTADSKKKIDSLRDTLVGKIPVPTDQVKQITLGLIYKFMSDIDQENKELGGKSFFNSDYDKYSWNKIMDRSLSSYDRVLLYSEGLDKMSLNPHIPQLFRDIFKGAFLPFRDPAIVDHFLRGINEFRYEHSEDLGDAFEYLLSIMGAQGDAGQFRTPRHIIDFIAEAVDPQKTDKILDPACGTAGFLIAAYKRILKANVDPKFGMPGSNLTTAEKNNLSKNFVGHEISNDMVRISLVNMYLHDFSEPKIYEYDTLTSLDRWEDNYDCILANPPFMTPKGGIRPHNRFSIRARRSEVLFVDYIMEHLTPNGKAGIIVPEGIIYQSATAYKALRKMCVDGEYLYAVVSLPAGVFNPYSAVKTSILFMDKVLAKKTDDILFIQIKNVGFDLGAQRREISKNDLPLAIKIINKLKKAIATGGDVSSILTPEDEDIAAFISKDEIREDKEYNLVHSKYKEFSKTDSIHKFGELGEYIEESKDRVGNKNITVWSVSNTEGFVSSEKYFDKKVASEDTSNYRIVHEDNFAYNPSRINVGSITLNLSGEKGAVSPMYVVFKVACKDDLDERYLLYLLKSKQGIEQIKQHSIGAVRHTLKYKDLMKISIPIPPIEDQKIIVAGLDECQKVISGARQTIEYYKPYIEIKATWEKVKLGEVCDVKSGGTPTTKNKEYWENGTIPWLGSSACKDAFVNEAEKFITEKGFKNSSAKKLKPKTTLIALVGATIGKTGFLTFESTTNQNIAGLYPIDVKKLLPEYLFYVAQTLYPHFLNLGAGKFRMANLGFIKDLQIPLPAIEKQKEIITEIEKERRIVNDNKKLIELFDQRMQSKMDEVWGK